MEYEYTLVNSPHHGSQPHSGPPGLRTSRCPYADASRVGRPDWSEVGGRFAESSAAYTPSWQSSSLSSQRWSPHNQPPVLRLEHPPSSHNFNAGLSSLGAYSNYTSPAPAPHPRPQTTNPPPSSTTAATTADSTQDGHQTPSTQVHVPATHVSLGTPRGMTPTSTAAPGSSTGAPTQSTTALTNLDQGDGSQTVNSTVVSSQPVSVRLPVPTGHSIYSRPQRHRLSSGRTALSEELLGEPSRTTTDGSGPSTSSSDDDSDLEIGPRLHFMGYQHSTRQSQILRGQMTNKRVASRKAIQSLQEVDMATLPEKEKSKLATQESADCDVEKRGLTLSRSMCHLLQRLWSSKSRGRSRNTVAFAKMQACLRKPVHSQMAGRVVQLSVLPRPAGFGARQTKRGCYTQNAFGCWRRHASYALHVSTDDAILHQ